LRPAWCRTRPRGRKRSLRWSTAPSASRQREERSVPWAARRRIGAGEGGG
jgi:hypothetical protein